MIYSGSLSSQILGPTDFVCYRELIVFYYINDKDVFKNETNTYIQILGDTKIPS